MTDAEKKIKAEFSELYLDLNPSDLKDAIEFMHENNQSEEELSKLVIYVMQKYVEWLYSDGQFIHETNQTEQELRKLAIFIVQQYEKQFYSDIPSQLMRQFGERD